MNNPMVRHHLADSRSGRRDEVTALFAAALEDDPVADAELRRRAIAGDPAAVVAFRALRLVALEVESREHPERFATLAPEATPPAHATADHGRGSWSKPASRRGTRGPR